MKLLTLRILIVSFAMAHLTFAQTESGTAPHLANPILPGYYADPCILQAEGKNYIYVTLDPWGDETLGCWESADFKSWTYRVLNWPTRTLCKSPTSGGAAVWAPSVVKARNGRFYMYVGVHSEVWAGVADHPLGPWKNAVDDKPLIAGNYKPGYHMIDPEAFIDDDGQAYLYWGSGLNWVNGKCWTVKLKPDMVTFDGEVSDVTPANYFEGPVMTKHGGKYYLSYSQGKTTADTYRVHYAIGKTPLSPFTEASNSPILVSDKAQNIIAPGHHTIFSKGGKSYILYHRQSIPFDPKFIGRQTCVDELAFTADGLISKIVPTHSGPALSQRQPAAAPLAAKATASSQLSESNGPDRVLDDNYATRWTPAVDDAQAWLQLDLGSSKSFRRQEIRPEYAWKSYAFKVETSGDGKTWQTLADFTEKPISGSPIVITNPGSARYLRIAFPEKAKERSFFEWAVY